MRQRDFAKAGANRNDDRKSMPIMRQKRKSNEHGSAPCPAPLPDAARHGAEQAIQGIFTRMAPANSN